MLPRNGETTQDARQVLLSCLDGGQTGCLAGPSPVGQVRVYVMLGEVLAAHAEDDDARILTLLGNAGTVELGRLEQLRARVRAGEPMSEALFETVSDQEVMDLLFERFRENLFQFLVHAEDASFTPMEAVFTDNIQVGHDSRGLIAELWDLRVQLAGLLSDLSVVLTPGTLPAEDPDQQRVLRLCGEGMPLSVLLDRAPWEGSRTLQRVLLMLDRGVLALGADTSAGDDMLFDEPPTEEIRGATAGIAWDGMDPELAAFQDYDTSRMGGDFTTERALLDRVELRDEAPPPPRPSLPISSEQIIEMEDAEHAGRDALSGAVSLNFSGPRLQDAEATRKVEVVNDVLATISRALEEVEGPGAGQAHLQVLIEGTPAQLAPLFKNIEVEQDGTLPLDPLMKNLRKRPVAEHRRLLNRALSDLIERALSLAYENLDEPKLEAMLERIAGYQQRLGI